MQATIYLTPEEVAYLLRLHPETVRRFCREGKIPAIHVGGVWRIPLTELAKLQGMPRGERGKGYGD